MVWYGYTNDVGTRCLITEPWGPYFAKTRGERLKRGLGQVIQIPLEEKGEADIWDVVTGVTEKLPDGYYIEPQGV